MNDKSGLQNDMRHANGEKRDAADELDSQSVWKQSPSLIMNEWMRTFSHGFTDGIRTASKEEAAIVF